MKILILHGPNLNLLGSREPEKYGHSSSEQLLSALKSAFPALELTYFQSNEEGQLVNTIQSAAGTQDGLLINAGGFSHTSVAIGDAIRSIAIPAISVHITNPATRESYRHTDIIGEACNGTIAGLGTDGYQLAMECLMDIILKKPNT